MMFRKKITRCFVVAPGWSKEIDLCGVKNVIFWDGKNIAVYGTPRKIKKFIRVHSSWIRKENFF